MLARRLLHSTCLSAGRAQPLRTCPVSAASRSTPIATLSRWLSTAKTPEDDDFFSPDDFAETGFEEKDINPNTKHSVIDPNNPPELSFEDYQQLKGMDLSQLGPHPPQSV